MLTEPLPSTLDVRKAAVRGVTVSGCLTVPKMPRLFEILASENGEIEARCEFSRDEENRYVIDVSVSAKVEVTCQRCLEAMPIDLNTENRLAVVGDDDQASQLPTQLEPLLIEAESCNLWEVVEDELILNLPIVSYHNTQECKQILEEYSTPEPEPGAGEDNPFKVLEQLKSSQKKQE